MKKLLFIPAMVCALAILLPSCKKDDPATPEDTTSNLFKITDNGTPYTATNVLIQHQNGFIEGGAPNSFTSGYAVVMPDTIHPGTYTLGPTSLEQITKTENSGSTNYTTQSGTMVITAHDTTTHFIKGTFSGIIGVAGTSNTRTITGGEFRLNY